MNKKNEVNINILKNIIESHFIGISLLVLILLNFFIIGKYASGNEYFLAFINVNNLFIYNTFLAVILLLSTLNTLRHFEQYKNIIIRYDNKKKYFAELVKMVILVNLLIIVIDYVLLFTGLNFFASSFNVSYQFSGVPAIMYAIFVLMKKVILFEILSLMFLLINKNLNKNIGIAISMIVVLLLLVAPYNDVYINSLSDFRLFYWDYFVYHRYSSFYLELSHFCLFFCLYTTIIYILLIFTSKRIKKIGE